MLYVLYWKGNYSYGNWWNADSVYWIDTCVNNNLSFELAKIVIFSLWPRHLTFSPIFPLFPCHQCSQTITTESHTLLLLPTPFQRHHITTISIPPRLQMYVCSLYHCALLCMEGNEAITTRHERAGFIQVNVYVLTSGGLEPCRE